MKIKFFNIGKIFVSLFFVLLVVFSSVFISSPTSSVAHAASSTSVEFDNTKVLEDLKETTIDGKKFTLADYPFDKNKELRVLHFVEYCFSYDEDKRGNYGLYVYIYNPRGIDIDSAHVNNKIQFNWGTSTDSPYMKCSLKFLNASAEEGVEGLFYKYKVSLTDTNKETMFKTLSPSQRVYRVSGIELVKKDSRNATEYAVSTTYTYTGFSAGYGEDPKAESTLTYTYEGLETLSLDVHSTVYRPEGSNGTNEFTQDQLHSVYFAVPNETIAKYGEMVAVHATWLQALLNPVLVTGNLNAYKAISSYLGKTISNEYSSQYGFDSELEYAYFGIDMLTYPAVGNTNLIYGYGYNCPGIENLNFALDGSFSPNSHILIKNWQVGIVFNQLYYMYYSGEGTDSASSFEISSNDLLNDISNSYAKYGGPLVNGKYHSGIFKRVDSEFTDLNIKADDTFKITNQVLGQNWWERLWGNYHVEYTQTFDNIKAIQAVTSDDLTGDKSQICDKLYIAEQDFDDFYNFYNKNKTLSTVYILRYRQSKYYSQDAALYHQEKGLLGEMEWELEDTNAYFFQQEMDLDFDIIDVTFSDGVKTTVMPVVSDPIDVVGSATPPIVGTTDDRTALYLIMAVLFLILGVILLFVLSIYCKPVFDVVIKVLVWIITAPFKLIGAIFDWIKGWFDDGGTS